MSSVPHRSILWLPHIRTLYSEKTSLHVLTSSQLVGLISNMNLEPSDLLVWFDITSRITKWSIPDVITIIPDHLSRDDNFQTMWRNVSLPLTVYSQYIWPTDFWPYYGFPSLPSGYRHFHGSSRDSSTGIFLLQAWSLFTIYRWFFHVPFAEISSKPNFDISITNRNRTEIENNNSIPRDLYIKWSLRLLGILWTHPPW